MQTAHLACLVLGLAGGFLVAEFVKPPQESVTATGITAATQQRIDALTEERDRWKQRAMAATQAGERVAVPEQRSGTPGQPDGVSHATRPAGDKAKAAPTGPEAPDPVRAAKIVAAVRSALEAGDSDALQKLSADLLAQQKLLVPELLSMLSASESLFAKEQLARMLGELMDPRAVPSLQKLLAGESDDAVRTATVRALGAIPDPSSVGPLTAEFGRESGSPMPASLAATALGNIGTADAVAALKKEIQDGANPMVRAFAMNALAQQKAKELVPFFFEQLGRQGVTDRYRRSAIDAILATGDKGAIYNLRVIALSPETSRGIQEAAKRAINQLSGQRVFDVR